MSTPQYPPPVGYQPPPPSPAPLKEPRQPSPTKWLIIIWSTLVIGLMIVGVQLAGISQHDYNICAAVARDASNC